MTAARGTIAPPRRIVFLAALVAALLAGLMGSLAPGLARPVRAAALKAVIVVGPVEGQTDGYVVDAERIASAAVAHGMDVRKLYSTNTKVSTSLKPTWQNVLGQIQGATIVAYLGHGNGWPNPYPPGYLMPDRVDGFVLDKSSGTPCALSGTKAYCGEAPIAANVHLAANAVVLLEHLCYASGESEGGGGQPSLATAKQRADNYGSGFLKAGAAAVFAYGVQDTSMVVDAIFATHQTLDGVFASTGYQGVVDVRFGSTRTPGSDVHMDPLKDPLSDGQTYYRSVVGNLTVTTDQVLGAPPPTPDPDRWSGNDRYGTAAAISTESFAPDVAVAYVATGLTFPDALAGAAAAGAGGAPILLTMPEALPGATIAELTRLKPKRIVILGGTGAVSSDVEAALHGYTTGSVNRLAGADRYTTAAAVSAATFASGVGIAYVATGENFPDALAGAAAAGKTGAPILLTTRDQLPGPTVAELTRLNPGRIVVLGGTGAVSAAVATELANHTKGSVTRLSGSDRYATAVAISQATYSSATTVYVATGLNFPDALAGAPLGGPLILVPGTWVPDAVRAEVVRLNPSRIVALGSKYVVSYSVVADLKAAVGIP